MDRLYQAMDLFILPSRIEGFPVVGVEAQANGLPVFFSDNVPREAWLSDSVQSLPLEAGGEQWASAVVAMERVKRKPPEDLRKYDIANQSRCLGDYYEVCLNELAKET